MTRERLPTELAEFIDELQCDVQKRVVGFQRLIAKKDTQIQELRRELEYEVRNECGRYR